MAVKSFDGGSRDIADCLWREQIEGLETSGRLYDAWANDGIDHFEWHGDDLVWFLKSGEVIAT